jgi:hypothetical protein
MVSLLISTLIFENHTVLIRNKNKKREELERTSLSFLHDLTSLSFYISQESSVRILGDVTRQSLVSFTCPFAFDSPPA